MVCFLTQVKECPPAYVQRHAFDWHARIQTHAEVRGRPLQAAVSAAPTQHI